MTIPVLKTETACFLTTNSHLYHYAGNNPVRYVDPDGEATIDDIQNFLDIVGCLPGVGDAVGKGGKALKVVAKHGDDIVAVGKQALKHGDEFVDAGKQLMKQGGNVSEKISKGWKGGDPIDNLTKAGKEPSWSTVRSRYWKNEALNNAEKYTEKNLDLMKSGKAPRNPEVDVPMELHHKNGRNIPNPHAQGNLQQVWSREHAEIDPYRRYTGPIPGGD